MAVLIPDMTMPENCVRCRFHSDAWCYAIPEDDIQPGATRPDRRPDWCPLVPIPSRPQYDAQLLRDCEMEE